jgi:FKBP-type peptidyl-prolyl cis-trans isomerase
MKIPNFAAWLATAIFVMSSPANSQEPPADVAAPPADSTKTDSGLAWKQLSKGTGDYMPKLWDSVSVHYTGWTPDGKSFDSSVAGGAPASFQVSGVINGWTEGLQLMVEGEKRRFWIPSDLAYGETPARPGDPAGDLVFDVELLEITKGEEPPGPPPADAVKSDTGLASLVLEKGTGSANPGETDIVTAHFKAWNQDGVMIGDSSANSRPIRAPLGRLLKGWAEGMLLMVEGEKRRIWIPEALASEGKTESGVPPGDLIFDVELVKFEKAPEVPKVPDDVAAAPDDAEKTASGLASKVLTKGSGAIHPKASDSVTVHYSGWTTDGKMFDSSVVRGEPSNFPLTNVIKGWTEGLQLMVAGETRRFWIPVDLAYGATAAQRGKPAGDLVFDVELISID